MFQTYLAGVDSNTVILVLDHRVLDSNASGLADIKAVRVMAAIVVAIRILEKKSQLLLLSTNLQSWNHIRL